MWMPRASQKSTTGSVAGLLYSTGLSAAYLGLPLSLVEKVPSDGLSGKTDEDNLGFTYAVLDRYIREGVCENEETKARIDRLHVMNEFKLKPIPCFEYTPEA